MLVTFACPTAHDEGVPQIMDARGEVRPAVAPAQLLTQLGEHALHLALAQRLSPPSASRADEERGIFLR